MERVRPLKPTVHHSSNPKRTIPAGSTVHWVPLDDTVMVTAGDFLLLVPVLAVELEVGAELDVVSTASCPEISEEKEIHSEPHFMTVYGQK